MGFLLKLDQPSDIARLSADPYWSNGWDGAECSIRYNVEETGKAVFDCNDIFHKQEEVPDYYNDLDSVLASKSIDT